MNFYFSHFVEVITVIMTDTLARTRWTLTQAAVKCIVLVTKGYILIIG